MSGQAWQREVTARITKELIESGFVTTDENGGTVLTEKGKKRAAARLDKLPIGDDILLEIAFCEAHHIGFIHFKGGS